jgi:hypothetical protein
MKQVYARSLVEGAPIGNDNAAGPHKRKTYMKPVLAKLPSDTRQIIKMRDLGAKREAAYRSYMKMSKSDLVYAASRASRISGIDSSTSKSDAARTLVDRDHFISRRDEDAYDNANKLSKSWLKKRVKDAIKSKK